MIDTRYCRWTAAEIAITVEYSTDALEQIRAWSVEAFQRLLHGGLEIGGVLFGRRDGKHIFVDAARRVPIEYTAGPGFLLSDRDRTAFNACMQAPASEPALSGMIPVGWFVSHSRSEALRMTEEDAELFREFFPERWQVTLVLKPARMGAARAGFFVREPDGTVHLAQSYREFDVAPATFAIPVPTGTPESRRERQVRSMVAPLDAAPAAAPVTRDRCSEPDATVTELPAAPEHSRKQWKATVVACAAGVLIFAGIAAPLLYSYVWRPAHMPSLYLTLSDREADLAINWNPAALRQVGTGTIEVVEAGASRLFQLNAAQLARGSYAAPHDTGDVRVRMTVYDRKGAVACQEAARYLGPVRARNAEPSPELAATRAEIARLRIENATLQAQVKMHSLRARELEKRLQAAGRIAAGENKGLQSSGSPPDPRPQ